MAVESTMKSIIRNMCFHRYKNICKGEYRLLSRPLDLQVVSCG